MTLPAHPRAAALGGSTTGPTRTPLTGTIVKLPAPGSKYLYVRLDGDSNSRVLARLVDGTGLTPALGGRVRCEMVGLELTVVRGA